MDILKKLSYLSEILFFLYDHQNNICDLDKFGVVRKYEDRVSTIGCQVNCHF